MQLDVEAILDGFEHATNDALDELDADLDKAGLEAAKGGVDAAKNYHPYTDRTGELTGNAHAEPDLAHGGGMMVWPEPYAGFVDEGTSRARPYPFTPLAEQVAERDLEHLTAQAVDKFKAKLER